MSRLIDADKLCVDLMERWDIADKQKEELIRQVMADIVTPIVVSQPTIEPERKTGKWIGTEYDGYADGNPVYYEWKCSSCGCVFEDEEPTYNYCPHCGAYMKGGHR